MAIAMVAMIAFGGTYAYFTAKADDSTATLTTAKLSLSYGTAAAFTTTYTDAVLPGDTISLGATISDESNRGSWIFFTVSSTAEDTDETDISSKLTVSISSVKVGSTAATTIKDNDKVYFIKVTDADATGNSYTGSYAVTATVTVAGDCLNAETASESVDANLMEATITVTFTACSIQLSAGGTEGNDDAKAAAAYAAYQTTYTALTTTT